MASVTINAPKTPVTEGNNGTAAATTPNVCKMPGPPAPFVPTPLPNIGRSGITPKGFSVKVRIGGSRVAIRGASFGSQGDVAAKASGGGLVSANVEGATRFVGPGSMDVRIEGKNVQLLGDPMLNNCGLTGAPPNAATLCGVITESGDVIAVTGQDECPLCGKKHEPLAESKATQADASTLKTMFMLATQPRTDPKTGERCTPMSTSTMLGVVHGQCGKRKYGGQSGAVHKELHEAARATQLESLGEDGPSYFPPEGVSKRVHRESKTAADKASTAAVKEAMFARVGGEHREVLEKVWEKAEEVADDSLRRGANAERTSYAPGSCAAQKTLLLARDRGCFPGALTELWHSQTGAPTAGKIRHLDSTGKLADEQFADGKAVPPCGTCVALLPYLLCPGDEAPHCKHKTNDGPSVAAHAPTSPSSPRAAPVDATSTQSVPRPPTPPSTSTPRSPPSASPGSGSGPLRGGGGRSGGGGASGDW